MQSVVASLTDAAFSLAGVSGLPTIAPVLGVLGLQTYTINSLFIAPLVAETMNVTFTPFNGAHMLKTSICDIFQLLADIQQSCWLLACITQQHILCANLQH